MKEISLKQAALRMNCSEYNVRRILRMEPERLGGRKIKVKRGKTSGTFEKWMLTVEDIDKYMSTKGRIKDGKKAYLVRLSPSEFKKYSTMFNKVNITIEPRYNPKD